ncbi:TetR family transcriptional regulator [Alphaproteobacteria bacterium HT1-32]|nr:TetR family transcriptional regulator [Alphaproteobacteria bacterium HT1-32]
MVKQTRSEQKHQAIVAAAHDIFLQKGFSAAGMDEIAEAAGVSKRTVYSHFGSKEDMFVALLERKCTATRENFVSNADETAPIDATLRELGRDFLAMIFQDETLKMFRILAAEADNFPDIGRRFFESGPEASTAAVAQYLERQKALGVIDIGDAFQAAGTLMSAMMNKRLIACLLKAAPIPTPDEREEMVQRTVAIFLDGVRR